MWFSCFVKDRFLEITFRKMQADLYFIKLGFFERISKSMQVVFIVCKVTFFKECKGRCKLRWLKSGKNPNPKSPYFNTRMEKTVKNQF